MKPKSWEEIAGKAHLYKTALHPAAGEYAYVALVGVLEGGTFITRTIDGRIELRYWSELSDFCL